MRIQIFFSAIILLSSIGYLSIFAPKTASNNHQISYVQSIDSTDRIKKWTDDINEYVKSLEQEEDGGLYHAISKEAFSQAKETLMGQIEHLNDMQIYIELCKLNAKVGVAHNIIIPKLPFNIFRLTFIPFLEGFVVAKTVSKYKAVLGKKLMAINGHPIETIIDTLIPLIPLDISIDNNGHKCVNSQWIRQMLPMLFLNNVDILQALGFIDASDGADFTFLDEKDTPFTLHIKSTFIEDRKQFNAPHNLVSTNFGNVISIEQKFNEKNYKFMYLDTYKTIYLKYNACDEDTEYPINTLVQDIKKYIDNKMVTTFIIDIRKNRGGDSSIIKPVIKEIKKALDQRKIKKVYCMIGNETFSSGFICARDFKKIGAILIGEPTGQPYNSYGECKMHTLPNSNISFQYSTKLIELDPGNNSIAIFPDISVPVYFQDYKKGIDKAFNIILERSADTRCHELDSFL